eukprot:SAG31_NODE_408_length_16015_cov_77.203569_3_plen_143_part_00
MCVSYRRRSASDYIAFLLCPALDTGKQYIMLFSDYIIFLCPALDTGKQYVILHARAAAKEGPRSCSPPPRARRIGRKERQPGRANAACGPGFEQPLEAAHQRSRPASERMDQHGQRQRGCRSPLPGGGFVTDAPGGNHSQAI